MKPQAGGSHSAPQEKNVLKLRHSARLSHDETFKHKFIDHISHGKETIADDQDGQRSICGTLLNKLNFSSNDGKNKPLRPSRSVRNRSNGTAELYRTDFITAMKLPDTEILPDYFLIQDQWKLDWERRVQVPVGSSNLNAPNICYNPYRKSTNSDDPMNTSFEISEKYLCPVNDKYFNSEINEPYSMPDLRSQEVSKYDYDQNDAKWLEKTNEYLIKMGEDKLSANQFEKLIESFETDSNDNLRQFLDNLKNYNIEYDEGIVCDVCRALDSECSNEMVFCDGCNICVHQACYGIDKIPSGIWLCGPCEYGGIAFKPDCLLCPNKGGSMKPTRNFRNWCHVSCALWTPETTFGNPLKLEPIININKIQSNRWRLTCSLCKIKYGCCVQCSEIKCHTAFHITCAFKHNLLVEQTIINGNVVSTCYCAEHSKTNIKENDIENDAVDVLNQGNEFLSDSEEEENDRERSFLVSLQSMNETERKQSIVNRLEKKYSRFYKNIDLEKIMVSLDMKSFISVRLVFNYWKLKRRMNVPANKALIYPRNVDDLMSQTENILTIRMNMFMHLRHDLERLRNLCYLVTKREKQKRQYYELNRQCFQKQVEYLNKYKSHTGAPECSPSSNSFQTFSNPKQNNHSHTTNNIALPTQRTTYRIRDILQVKNENCLYDFPEKWSVTKEVKRENIETIIKDEEANQSADSTNIHKIKKKQHVTQDICKKYRNLDISRNKKSEHSKSFPRNSQKNTKFKSEPNIIDISINVLNNQKQTLSQVVKKLSPIRQNSKNISLPKPGGNQTKENNRQIRSDIIMEANTKRNSLSRNLDNQIDRKHALRTTASHLKSDFPVSMSNKIPCRPHTKRKNDYRPSESTSSQASDSSWDYKPRKRNRSHLNTEQIKHYPTTRSRNLLKNVQVH